LVEESERESENKREKREGRREVGRDEGRKGVWELGCGVMKKGMEQKWNSKTVHIRQITIHTNTISDKLHVIHPHNTIVNSQQSSAVTCASAHLKIKLLFTKPKILRGHKATQENVDSFSHRERHGNYTVRRWCAVQYADVICVIIMKR
jgi:hypothetical protein